MFTGINYDDLYYLVLAMSAKEYRSEEILVHGPKKGETGSYPENVTLVFREHFYHILSERSEGKGKEEALKGMVSFSRNGKIANAPTGKWTWSPDWWWRWRRNVSFSFSLSAFLSLFSAFTLFSRAHNWSLYSLWKPVKADVLHKFFFSRLSNEYKVFAFQVLWDRTDVLSNYSRLQLRWFPRPRSAVYIRVVTGVFYHPNVYWETGTRNHLSCNREYSRLQLRWFRIPVFQYTLGWSKRPADHPEVYRGRGPVARKPSLLQLRVTAWLRRACLGSSVVEHQAHLLWVPGSISNWIVCDTVKVQIFVRYPFSFFRLEIGSHELNFVLLRASKI